MTKSPAAFYSLMITLGTFLVLMTSTFSASAAAISCSDVFSEVPTANSIQQTIHSLSELRLNLDLAKAKGKSSIELTALAADYINKEKLLVQLLEKYGVMTRAELIEKMKAEILALQSKKQPKDQLREEEARRVKEQEQRILLSTIDGSRVIMHRIEPGSFEMTALGTTVPVKLTKPFDMMATLTTQVIWKRVAEIASTHVATKNHMIDADPSHFKGATRPVEMVAYIDVQTWIHALNQLSNFGEPLLADIIPDHKKGDVYRLPTEAEWEFVVRGRGQLNDKFHFGNQDSKLDDYAWHAANSDQQTHPVAQKQPLVIEGKGFYDMYGNVDELTHDWFSPKFSGGVDPQGPETGFSRVARGDNFKNSKEEMGSRSRGGIGDDSRFNTIGFRLVRTVKDKGTPP